MLHAAPAPFDGDPGPLVEVSEGSVLITSDEAQTRLALERARPPR